MAGALGLPDNIGLKGLAVSGKSGETKGVTVDAERRASP